MWLEVSNFGNLPERADCKMVLTLPQEFMAKPNQTETLEKAVPKAAPPFLLQFSISKNGANKKIENKGGLP